MPQKDHPKVLIFTRGTSRTLSGVESTAESVSDGSSEGFSKSWSVSEHLVVGMFHGGGVVNEVATSSCMPAPPTPWTPKVLKGSHPPNPCGLAMHHDTGARCLVVTSVVCVRDVVWKVSGLKSLFPEKKKVTFKALGHRAMTPTRAHEREDGFIQNPRHLAHGTLTSNYENQHVPVSSCPCRCTASPSEKKVPPRFFVPGVM